MRKPKRLQTLFVVAACAALSLFGTVMPAAAADPPQMRVELACTTDNLTFALSATGSTPELQQLIAEFLRTHACKPGTLSIRYSPA